MIYFILNRGTGGQWCSGKFSLVGTLAWHYGRISYRYRGGGGGGGVSPSLGGAYNDVQLLGD